MPLVGARILIVEDEPLVAMLAEDMVLDEGGVVIGPAATVAAALALVETETIDAAILDVNLNNERSYPVADALADKDVPFVFVSGYQSLGSEAPPGRLIHKPYNIEHLRSCLLDMLGG